MDRYINKALNTLKEERTYEIIFWIFWTVLLIVALAKAYFITPNDFSNENFLQTYKFFTPDSFDWINNAKYFASNVETSLRQPGYSLLLKFFLHFNILGLVPYLNHLVLVGTLFLLFKTLVVSLKPTTVQKYLFLIIFFFLFDNYYLQYFANYILSDLYAIFFVVASVYLLTKRNYLLSALLLGISWLFQNYAPFIVPAYFLYFIYISESKKDWIIKCAIFSLHFLLPSIPWFFYKIIRYGNPFYTTLGQADLVNPNLNSLLYYFVNGTGVFGFLFIPILILIFFQLKKYVKSPILFFYFAGLLFTGFLWVILYEWNDRRFLLYFIPFLIPLGVEMLIRSRLDSFQKLLVVCLALFNSIVLIPNSNGVYFENTIALTPWESVSFDMSAITDKGYHDLNTKIYRTDVSRLSIITPFFAQAYSGRTNFKSDKETPFSYYKEEIYTDADDQNVCFKEDRYYYSYYIFNNVYKYYFQKNADNITVLTKNCE